MPPKSSALRAREYRARYPERVKAQQMRWRDANPERYKRAVKNSWLKSSYGITIDEYETLIEAQNGLCAICHEPPHETNTRGHLCLYVDHVETENGPEVRGLLCDPCNKLLGFARNNRERLFSAAVYLARHELDLKNGVFALAA